MVRILVVAALIAVSLYVVKENGMVTELWFSTDNASEISPVRALAGLKRLLCLTPNHNNKLSDLSPLRGLRPSALRK